MDKNFDTKLLKMVAAEFYFLCSMSASREMFGKGYFSLGVAEKQSLDSAVWSQISGNFAQITPELLKEQTEGPKVGFHQPSASEPEAGSS